MGRIQKKGVKGAAANFITRQQALKKLQISLADFRRLCILKGIYPREPRSKKKANKGSTAPATFYYVKDIQYLLHEPLLMKFREYKAFARKLNKVLHKGDKSTARSLNEHNRPVYTLDHLVKERYPTFVDALRDLDDAISMLYLFANMPVDSRIKAKTVKQCQTLIAEFQNYVMHAQCLRKVFFSIKGIYYQAEIKGQTITWIVPYQFTQEVPTDVDFRVMATFLEFYITLMGFVNYRLYNDLNLTYPPDLASGLALDKNPHTKTAEDEDDAAAEAAAAADLNEFKDEDASGDVSVREIQEATLQVKNLKELFKSHTFFLSRETPRYAMEFMIRSCGGAVSWDKSLGGTPPMEETDERVTIQVSDRPKVNRRVMNRTYVQPQWIADCINARKLLKSALYAPGELLPPHLSPFVIAKPGEYVPTVDDDEDEELAQAAAQAAAETAAAADEDDTYEDELKAEAAGVPFSEYDGTAPADDTKRVTRSKKRAQDNDEHKEAEEMATVMMSNKKRKLYTIMKESNQRKADEAKKLQDKKKALKAKKK
ncbi:Pescadillo N-terminus-domain-containing protein [Gongronella butleri]|nr:Pescadillo N-terminus-domain-containing protein [Gongronella butleri]